jgi:probable F420-dependent oxidoreductase
MKYGFTVPRRGPLATPDSLAAIARRGEELGCHLLFTGDSIVVPRHITSRYPYSKTGELPSPAPNEAMEQLTVLAFLAGQTRSIRLVTSIIIVPSRNPLVAAKALATLDVLSKGRLIVGVGVGWMREEFEALGLPPFEERSAVTDEYIRAFKKLWTSDNPTFEGKYCRFSNISFLPKPAQKPHPLIWVGGESLRALRRTAELGNGWYPIGSNPQFPLETPEQLEARLQRLAAYAEQAGRDPAEIEIIYLVTRASGDHRHHPRSPKSLYRRCPRGRAAGHAGRRPLPSFAEPRRSPRPGVQCPWDRAQGGERRVAPHPRHPAQWPDRRPGSPEYADASGPVTGGTAPSGAPRYLCTGLDAVPRGVVESHDCPAPRHWVHDRRAVSPGADLS